MYIRAGNVWSLQAKRVPDNAAATNYFGYSVAIYGDTVVVGALGDDDEGLNSGSAYVYTRKYNI